MCNSERLASMERRSLRQAKEKFAPWAIALLLTGPGWAGATPSVSGVNPSLLEAASPSRVTISGAELDSFDTMTLQSPGRPDLVLDITSQTPTAVQGEAWLGGAATGIYDVVLSGPSVPDLVEEHAIELTRPYYIAISGEAAPELSYPLYSGLVYTNTQMIYLADEVGRAGAITAVRLYPVASAGTIAGTVVVRMKETSNTEFSGNNLDGSGWQNLYSGSLPAMTPGSPLTIYATSAFSYGGTNNLMVSILFTATTPGFGNYWTAHETGANRMLSGQSNTQATPIATWSGSTPTFRVLDTRRPNMDFNFFGTQVTAQFSATAPAAETGEAIQFQDLSTGLPTAWKWDFDSDGTIDSLAQNPQWSYPLPGTYTVELTASNAASADTESKTGLIEITAAQASVLDWPLLDDGASSD